MIRKTARFLKESVLFRRVVASAFHAIGIFLCYWFSFLLRFDFAIPEGHWAAFSAAIAPVFLGYFLAILLFGLYRGLWRFFTLRDCYITGVALAAGTLLAGAGTFFSFGGNFEGFPRSTLIVTFFLLLAWEIGWRGVIRLIREHRIRRFHELKEVRSKVILVGDPDEADGLLRMLIRSPEMIGSVVGIVSEKSRYQGARLRGVRVYGGLDRLESIVAKTGATTLLFLPPVNTPGKIRDVVDRLAVAKVSCQYRLIPSMGDLASGKISVDAIKEVSIEDLLFRPSYEIDLERVVGQIEGSRILVTGAGGSIGSEIARQVLRLRPKSLTLFEVGEYQLFEIERELKPLALEYGVTVYAVAGDVCSGSHLKQAIKLSEGVEVLYHAAAYKHVDLMERNPVVCFQNNVIGTSVAAATSEEMGVGQFVLISTDKAVRPTSLMGASKRLAEMVVINRPVSGTKFGAVRFGNVLGSSGSVIPIFRKQISRGGPVTVTSKEVTRFFMTIPEAVELVLAAGASSVDRQISVLEMGDPVKIDTLARRMIKLSGFVPDVDIKVEYIGLKPGEKQYEELLTEDEGTVKTQQDRIWIVNKDHANEAMVLDIGGLLDVIDQGDVAEIREYAHALIPGSLLMEGRQSSEP